MALGGTKANAKLPALFDQAGGARQSSILPVVISSALAGAPPPATCSEDSAVSNVGHAAQPDSINQRNTAEFLPGLNNVPWGAMINGNFIVLSGMAVLRNHAIAANDALIEIYPQWNTVQDKLSAKPAFSLPTRVHTYEAQTGFIYRAFVLAPKAPISCLDILIPYTGMQATTGAVHYKEAGVDHTARFVPIRLAD